MIPSKSIFISTLVTSLVLLAGCTIRPAVTTSNMNTVSNANTDTISNQNVNAVLVENTNTEQGSEVDLSADLSAEVSTKEEALAQEDWLTYTNEEYGFSFRYPMDWGEAVVTTREADGYQIGSITQIIFDDDRSRKSGGTITAVIKVETADYQFTGSADGQNILFSEVNLTQSEEQISEVLKTDSTINNQVTKITTLNNVIGIRVDETLVSLGGEEQYYVEYLFPKFNSTQNFNLRIYGEKEIEQNLELLVNSLMIDS